MAGITKKNDIGATDQASKMEATKTQQFSLKSRIIASTLVILGLVVGLGGWAASAKLSSAVIAQGTVVVAKSVKKIQHREGGIVAAIKVENGDRVKTNDLLVKLDDTQVRAALGVVNSQIMELSCRRARLAAERDGLAKIDIPESISMADPEFIKAMAGEQRVFKDNKEIRDSQKKQLHLRIKQFEQEIKGLKAQRASKGRELKPVVRELAQLRKLHARKLATVVRVNAMEREAERIRGAIGGLDAQIARAAGQISEVRLQILAVDQKARTTSQKELRSIDAKLSELAERRKAAQDRLARTELRAPMSGIIHQLSVHTIGGVVSSAEPLMLIVPESDRLTVEVRFAPSDIDQIKVGQPAKIRFSAFNQRTTPEVMGKISHVAADVARDVKTGFSYYLGRLDLDANALHKIGDRKLLPGMPAEVFVTTSQRSALSYFAKPFMDQLQRAFREN